MMAEYAVLCLSLASLISFFMLLGLRNVANTPAADCFRLYQRLAGALFGLVSFAFAALIYSHAISDFSLANVYGHSHTAKPFLYKITGAWGNHEGSMLLWVWVLSLFTAGFACRQRRATGAEEQRFTVTTLAILAGVACGFLLFILLTSNPFERLVPPPAEGQDLNPLLQDIGLAIHPPMLYLGYVGFSVVFAMATAALWLKSPIGPLWARRIRPWALLAWAMLTAGIGLGSWWAYRELGWGGWWFWDPVENVSLLPWLSATALIHCLLVLSRRAALQNWTVLLALLTFIFSLLGTFLVRSGILTSVHSFANDPARGLYVLGFISVVTGFGFWLYARNFQKTAAPDFAPVSKEGAVLLNNILLVTLCATVFLGVLYPIFLQVTNAPAVSVGAPYYNSIFVPLAFPLLFMAGVGPMLAWRQVSWRMTRRLLGKTIIASAIALLALSPALPPAKTLLGMAAVLAGLWLIAGSFVYLARLASQRSNPDFFGRFHALNIESYGFFLAHAGMGIFVLSAALSTMGRLEYEQPMKMNERIEFAGLAITPLFYRDGMEENYRTQSVELEVIHRSGKKSVLFPETRFYPVRRMETAEAALSSQVLYDFYAAINVQRIENSAPSIILRLYFIPFMTWLWMGFIFMATGGTMAAIGSFRKLQKADSTCHSDSPTP